MKRALFIVAAVPAFWLGSCATQDAHAQISGSTRRHAQSPQELNDYRAAGAAKGGPSLEQSAVAFAQKYPQSELRSSLFSKAMREYQRENNANGILAMGQAVLAIDANDPQALVLTATVMADSLGPEDTDRDHKIAAIKKNISRALQIVSVGAPAPGTVPNGTEALYKSTLQSMSYSALGLMRLKTGDYADAERDLKAAVERAAARPDPFVWYHLALAQDHRKRYPAALNSVEQALQLASGNPELQKLAEAEHDRLSRLTGRGKDPAEGAAQPPR